MNSRHAMQTNNRYRLLDREKAAKVWVDPEEVRVRVRSEVITCPACGEMVHPDNWQKHLAIDHPGETVPYPAKDTLTTDEQAALQAHESIIERGLKTFIDVGMALAEINAQRLYRAEYATFEAYLDERWNLKRTRGYALMQAAQTVHRLSEISDIEIRYESHAKELANLEPEAAVAVYHFVKEVSPTGKVTTSGLRSAAAVIKEAMQTGAIYDSDGYSLALKETTPNHVKAAVTGDVYETMKRQQQHIAEAAQRKQAALVAKAKVGELVLQVVPRDEMGYVRIADQHGCIFATMALVYEDAHGNEFSVEEGTDYELAKALVNAFNSAFNGRK